MHYSWDELAEQWDRSAERRALRNAARAATDRERGIGFLVVRDWLRPSGKTSAELVKRAGTEPDLKRALIAICRKGRVPTGRELGAFLRSAGFVNRRYAGVSRWLPH